MQNAIKTIKFPEMFFGFVAPVGTDIEPSIRSFTEFFEREGYEVIRIKVTDYFRFIKNQLKSEIDLKDNGPLDERLVSYIDFGNFVRASFRDDSVLAAYTIFRIMRERNRSLRFAERKEKSVEFEKRVYILHQFKRKEEINLLRSVYGRLFFQVSVYSRREVRLHNLAKRIAHSHNSADKLSYLSKANDLLVRDENEIDDSHGQRVSKIFHDADFIVSADYVEKTVHEQITRFCELIFSSNSISPNKMEYGMFAAKGAALRTLDLSRQVGAAIFKTSGEILSLGSNEVPKAGGGTYWADEEPFDAREYVLGEDSNDARKKEILGEIAKALGSDKKIDELLAIPAVKDSQFMDALEYGRIVHAEMSAITDAARMGRPLAGAVLYCTTFPCHMCAKHIVAAGVTRVVFLEPYPKSLASDLHADSIQIEQGGRGSFEDYDAVGFEHFFGVTPRRYRELFDRDKRKQGSKFTSYINSTKRPNIDYKYPFYQNLESNVVEDGLEALGEIIGEKTYTLDIGLSPHRRNSFRGT